MIRQSNAKRKHTHKSAELPASSDAVIYEAAKQYACLGWSLIPIKPRTKTPACDWKRYQDARADEDQLCQWFNEGVDRSIAVVMGAVSGDLVCRDFDEMGEYERWAESHPALAKSLPTVATPRPGRHVYFRCSDVSRTK